MNKLNLTKQELEQFTETYTSILRHFHVNQMSNVILEGSKLVSMDNIHDSIIYLGFTGQPVGYYIRKATQLAINDVNAIKRRNATLFNNQSVLLPTEFTYDSIEHYGFDEQELYLTLELLNGIKKYQSSISRRQYNKILDSIKEKIKNSLKT